MQIQSVLSAASCLALLAGAGLARAASISNADRQFMIVAARTDMTEAHEGQMAEQQAAREDVKTFAKTQVQDHNNSYEQLGKLATKTAVSIPKGIDVAKDRTIEQLAHLKGAQFDRQFARDEIAADQRAISLFKQEAKHGQDADVKAYAEKTIPVLEKHLHLAEECAKPPRRS